jgi:hypothetical protein
VVSVHDADMRHGHKSNGKVYSGHKLHVAVDTAEGVITAVDITAPGEADGSKVSALIEQTENLTGAKVEQALGDTAYSSRTATIQAEQANVELVTKMAAPRKGQYGPASFEVSADGEIATCPAGFPSSRHARDAGRIVHYWSPDHCSVCPLKDACTKAVKRSLSVPPDFHDRRDRERYAHTAEGRGLLRKRVAVEHAIGRIKNLGANASRYFGRVKTKAQILWSAAVVNLSTAWSAAPTVVTVA